MGEVEQRRSSCRGDGVPLEVGHRLIIHGIPCQVAVLGNCSLRCSTSCIHAVVGIALNQTLALQETAHTPGDGMGELCEFVTGRRLHPLKPHERPVPSLDVHAVQNEHVGRSNASCVRGISASMHVKWIFRFSPLPKRWISVTAPL